MQQIEIISTGEIIFQIEFFDRHPETSFPRPLTDEVLIDFDARVHIPPPEPVTVEQARVAVQDVLDGWAQGRNYDGILSACTYATSMVPKFAAEGQRAVNVRDAAWAACYQFLAEVHDGARPAPMSVQEVLAILPLMHWADEEPEAPPPQE